MLTISFILCTRNRPSNIKSLVESIFNLDSAGYVSVTVVDSSDDERRADFSGLNIAGKLNLKVLHSPPGLPTQRNLGISSSTEPIIVFLDDDVELPTNFISSTLHEFNVRPELAGLGYVLRGVKYSSGNSVTRWMSGLTPSHYGQVSKSGINLWYPENCNSQVNPPMWLPGCAMAFRRASLGNHEFNPLLEQGILGGYALGEDVDFTLSLSGQGKVLGLCTTAIVNHYEALGERDDRIRLGYAHAAWLKYLAVAHSNQVKLGRTFLRVCMESLYVIAAFTLRRKGFSEVLVSLRRIKIFMSKGPYKSQSI